MKVDWDVAPYKMHTYNIGYAKCHCKRRDYLFASCADDSCVNYGNYIECPSYCNCAEACGNKRITNKKIKNVIVFNSRDKGLGLKTNELFIRKDDYINEYVGLAMSKDKSRNHDHGCC